METMTAIVCYARICIAHKDGLKKSDCPKSCPLVMINKRLDEQEKRLKKLETKLKGRENENRNS